MSTTNLRSGEGAFTKDPLMSKVEISVDFSVNNVLAADFLEILNLPADWYIMMALLEVTEASTDTTPTVDVGVITYSSGVVSSIGSEIANDLDMATEAVTVSATGGVSVSASHADRVIGINPNSDLTSGVLNISLLLAKLL